MSERTPSLRLIDTPKGRLPKKPAMRPVGGVMIP